MLQRRSVSRLLILTYLIFIYLPNQTFAQDSTPWNVENPLSSDTTVLDVVLRESTWMSLDVSSDGKKIAFDLLGHIYEVSVDGGEAEAITSGRSWNITPRYSPDGKRIAMDSDRGGAWALWVIDSMEDSLTYKQVSVGNNIVAQPTWALDGEAIYGTSYDDFQRSHGTRYSFHGQQQVLYSTGVYQPATHFAEHPSNRLIYFEHVDQRLYSSGARIKTYNKKTGAIEVFLQREGGAFNPTLSKNGKYLAYGHRLDQETVIILHDLETGEEKVIAQGLDHDHQDLSPHIHGTHYNYSWHPNNKELFFAKNGKINAVNIETGKTRVIPFSAKVKRTVNKSMRFKNPVPDKTDFSKTHRWAQRTKAGVIFETLGDIYLKDKKGTHNITNSETHETSPIYHPGEERIYYASWSDKELGAIYSIDLKGKQRTKHDEADSYFGGLAISTDGKKIAYFKGPSTIPQGVDIETMTDFELILLENGEKRVVTKAKGSPNFASKLPLTITFSKTSDKIYYTDYVGDLLKLNSINTDGSDKLALYSFPHSTYAKISPNLDWITFREYQKDFVTPFEFLGKEISISEFDHQGYTLPVDSLDGPFMDWTANGENLNWSRGKLFYEKPLEAIISKTEDATKKENISVPFEVNSPEGYLALTNARIITMNGEEEIVEEGTVLVKDNRIEQVGKDISIPRSAHVMDLEGATIIPGIVDAHAHYGSWTTQFNVIQQMHQGLASGLAHGVTTMFELYGMLEKDFWLADMVNKGDIRGARLFSTGPPVFGLRFFRNKSYQRVRSLEEAKNTVSLNKAYGALALKDYLQQKRKTRQFTLQAARELELNVVSETAGDLQMSLSLLVDGVSGLEHTMGASPLYNDVTELFKASGAGLTPTLLVVYNGPWGQFNFTQEEKVWDDPKLLNFLRKEDLLANRRRPHIFEDDMYAIEMAREMKKLYDAGVKLNLGGHGQMFGLDAHWEMVMLTKGGFTNLETLKIATINGATYHGLGDDLGSIERGKMADFVILETNPLDDIRNTRSIRYVIKNGVVYNGNDISEVYPQKKPTPPMYFMREAFKTKK